MAPRLTQAQKSMAYRLRALGFSKSEIARQVGCTDGLVVSMFQGKISSVGVATVWTPRLGALTIEDREQILLGLRAGHSMSAIARELGRAPSTITREVKANGGRDGYRAWTAHERARSCARRPKPCKLHRGPLLREVARRLQQLWSPQEIARRLPLEYPEDPTMRVSHETIYQSLFVQGRGELRRELTRCLRSGRTSRKNRSAGTAGGNSVKHMVMISERPPEVDDRAIPGHWEGDLILGAGGRSAVGTLVERTSRLVLLLHLANGRTAVDVETAMRKAVRSLPQELVKSITWDQGAEMATHVSFTVTTGIPIYFCDPHAPWQRGSNENTNGLLRQYMPKGSDLSKVSAAELKGIQRSLNGRPRATLGYKTPSEKFAEIVASTG